MGYSGRDDFDITPLFTENKDLKSLIWIEHQIGNDTGIQFTDYSLLLKEEMQKGITKDEKRVNQEESFIDRFLFNLCKLGIYKVYKIKGNTKTIIKNELWPIFYPTELVDEKDKDIFGNALSVASASHTTDKFKNLTEFEHFIDDFYQNIKPNKKYSIAARIYSDLSRDDEVMRVCEQALPIVRSSNDFEALSILLNDIGLVFMNHGDLDKALQNFEESLVNIRKLGITVMEGFRFSEIGLIYKKRNELDKALQYYNQAKEILEKYNELGGLTIVYNNIGALYLQKEEINLALENMQKALKLAEQIGDLQRKATRLSNIATIYLEYKHEPQKAMKYTKEALSIDEQIGDTNSIIVVLNNLAQNYEEIGDKQLAIQTYLRSI